MSETIKGKLQEIIAVKSGSGKRGKWTLWAVKVGDEKYGTKFEKVKAAVGDLVQFESEENENGYNDVVEGTFEVLKKATSEESAAVSKANGEAENGKQSSIEAQVTLKAAVDFVASFEMSFDDALTKIPVAYRVLAGCLHPALPSQPIKVSPKKKVEPEDENQDEIPY